MQTTSDGALNLPVTGFSVDGSDGYGSNFNVNSFSTSSHRSENAVTLTHHRSDPILSQQPVVDSYDAKRQVVVSNHNGNHNHNHHNHGVVNPFLRKNKNGHRVKRLRRIDEGRTTQKKSDESKEVSGSQRLIGNVHGWMPIIGPPKVK